LDFGDDLLDTAPDRAKVLDSLFPQEPRLVSAARIASPALQQRLHHVGHLRPQFNRATSTLADSIERGCIEMSASDKRDLKLERKHLPEK